MPAPSTTPATSESRPVIAAAPIRSSANRFAAEARCASLGLSRSALTAAPGGSARDGRRRRLAHLVLGHRPALERVVAGGGMAVAEGIELRLLDVAVPFVEARAARV